MAKNRSKGVDAIDLLKQDHDRVEKAFQEFEDRAQEDAEASRDLMMSVCEALKIHTRLEEEIFYPAVHDAIMVGFDDQMHILAVLLDDVVHRG